MLVSALARVSAAVMGRKNENDGDLREMMQEHVELIATVRRSVETHGEFRRAQLTGDQAAETAAALSALVVYEGSHIAASDLIPKLTADVPRSQVYEQWAFDSALAVRTAAKTLADADAEILLCASGLHGVTMTSLYVEAAEAVSDAWDAMYAEPREAIDHD